MKDNEPLTTKFESYDKQDVQNIVDELNVLSGENSLIFNTIQEHMEAYKEMLEEQEGILFGNAPQERLNALQGLLDAWLLKSVKDSHEGPVGRCRCTLVPEEEQS